MSEVHGMMSAGASSYLSGYCCVGLETMVMTIRGQITLPWFTSKKSVKVTYPTWPSDVKCGMWVLQILKLDETGIALYARVIESRSMIRGL